MLKTLNTSSVLKPYRQNSLPYYCLQTRKPPSCHPTRIPGFAMNSYFLSKIWFPSKYLDIWGPVSQTVKLSGDFIHSFISKVENNLMKFVTLSSARTFALKFSLYSNFNGGKFRKFIYFYFAYCVLLFHQICYYNIDLVVGIFCYERNYLFL